MASKLSSISSMYCKTVKLSTSRASTEKPSHSGLCTDSVSTLERVGAWPKNCSTLDLLESPIVQQYFPTCSICWTVYRPLEHLLQNCRNINLSALYCKTVGHIEHLLKNCRTLDSILIWLVHRREW